MSGLPLHGIRGKMTALFPTAESSVSLIYPVCTCHHKCDSSSVLKGRRSLNRSLNTVKKLEVSWPTAVCCGLWTAVEFRGTQ